MPDGPVAAGDGRTSFLTDAFIAQGTRFALLEFGEGEGIGTGEGLGLIRIGGEGGLTDPAGLVSARYDAEPGTVYLLRPDGYVAARFRKPTRQAIEAALARASGIN
jgi:3-(3-hydroxy-phenyl)propionate hydroxylase